jgi:hypothetical protein
LCDPVDKITGYKYPGIVVGVFKKLDGVVLYAVELPEFGLVHIFREDNLVARKVTK